MVAPATIPEDWACTPPPERLACFDLAAASVSMAQFVLKDAIDAYFEAHSPSWHELRRETWQASYFVETDTILIGETEFEVYLANQAWMIALWECFLDEGCDVEDEVCSYVEGFNPITPLDV